MTYNGIDTDRLAALAESMVTNPDAARVSARVRTNWDDGYQLRATSEEFHLAGEQFPRDTTLTVDLPQVLGGTDIGPAPGELLLAALGSCVTQAFIETAAVAGVRIDQLEIAVEGHLDLRGTAGVEGVRPGMSGIHLDVEVTSPAGVDVLDALMTAAVRRSPVADSLRAGVAIDAAVRQTSPA